MMPILNVVKEATELTMDPINLNIFPNKSLGAPRHRLHRWGVHPLPANVTSLLCLIFLSPHLIPNHAKKEGLN